jgi:uncharacterized protein YdhG (YjbR/CyaY superfamily)
MERAFRNGDISVGGYNGCMERRTATDIDEYISWFPDDIQKILKKIRATIKKAAPRAVESISYQIPTFKIDGKVLIYFAAFTKHVSLYPAPRDIVEFKDELKSYKGGKGTIQLPLDDPIPYELVARIVKFRMLKSLE